MTSNGNKVLLIGISGMDYKITKGLMAAGKLPTLKRLAEQGSFIKLDTSIPAEQAVAWTCLSTGLNPGKHHLFDTVQRNPLTYLPILVSTKQNDTKKIFKSKPVWDYIAEAGFYSSVENWLIESSLETNEKIDKTSPDQSFKQMMELETGQENLFWQKYSEFRTQERGFLGFKFDALNQLQQQFWNDRSIGKETDKIVLNKVVVDYYEQKDLFLQQIIAKVDDRTILLIVSNHGISSSERSVHLNNWLVEQGFMHLTTEVKSRETHFFNGVDWDTTRVYALGFSSVYLNLEHREGKGIVQDKEPLLRELITKLEQIIDPKTGERIIHRVYRKEEIYSGAGLTEAPDLIINFKPGYQMSWQTAVGGFGSQIIEDNAQITGDHLIDYSFIPGVLFSNRKMERLSAHCLDVAPTILDWLGIKIPHELDGQSLDQR